MDFNMATLIVAIVTSVAVTINAGITVMSWILKGKVRLKINITPGFTSGYPNPDDNSRFGISAEVINLSEFPVTLKEVGWNVPGEGAVLTSMLSPDIHQSGGTLPSRMESRTSYSAFFVKPKDQSVKLASVTITTSCGHKSTKKIHKNILRQWNR